MKESIYNLIHHIRTSGRPIIKALVNDPESIQISGPILLTQIVTIKDPLRDSVSSNPNIALPLFLSWIEIVESSLKSHIGPSERPPLISENVYRRYDNAEWLAAAATLHVCVPGVAPKIAFDLFDTDIFISQLVTILSIEWRDTDERIARARQSVFDHQNLAITASRGF